MGAKRITKYNGKPLSISLARKIKVFRLMFPDVVSHGGGG